MTKTTKTFIQVIVALIILIIAIAIPRMGKQSARDRAIEKKGQEVFSLDTSVVYPLYKIHGLYTKINKYGGYPTGALAYLGECKVSLDTGLIIRKKQGRIFKTIKEDLVSIPVKYKDYLSNPNKYEPKVIIK